MVERTGVHGFIRYRFRHIFDRSELFDQQTGRGRFRGICSATTDTLQIRSSFGKRSVSFGFFGNVLPYIMFLSPMRIQ